MKKLLAIALSFSFFALNANAQVTRNVNASQKVQRDSTHKRKDGQMMKDLNLTAAQKTQWKENQQNLKQQRDALKNDASLTQEQKKEKMKELNQAQHEKMNSILTPDQKAKMQADKKQWKEENKGKKRDGKRQRSTADTSSERS